MSHPLWYNVTMKTMVKARTNKDGLMGSKSRVHRPKRGKGSYRRNPKHKSSENLRLRYAETA
jgi:stalled ribosome alternative rescue factor ArfA